MVLRQTRLCSEGFTEQQQQHRQARKSPWPKIRTTPHHSYNHQNSIAIRKMGQVLRKLLETFYTKKLDIVVIGLENR